MQKTNIKASILIWSTFLSLIITVTFISISTQINKNLKNNSDLTNELKINNQINNIINSWSLDWNFITQTLENWEKVIFNTNNIITSLKKSEEITVKIIKDNKLTIKILKWWPIIASWSLIKIEQADISVQNWDNFIINNLWWYSQIEIISDTENSFLLKNTYYEIKKQIWNKEVIKSKWLIKNF